MTCTDFSSCRIAVKLASFPDKNPPNPKETKNIPIMVLTFFRQERIVIAEIPTGDSKSSATDISKYEPAIKNGEIFMPGVEFMQTSTMIE